MSSEGVRRTVSVVIPVRDDADFLERCLEALDRQTVAPDEIVVVDNRSSDRTPTIARRRRVRLLEEPMLGIPPAASAGYDAASGEIIARLDADSVPPPGWTARIHAAWDAEPGLDAITGPGRLDSVPRLLRPIATLLYMRSYFALSVVLLGRPALFGSNFAMTRDVWASARSRVHRTDPRVHDDLDLSFALPRGSRVRYEPGLALHISSRPLRTPLGMALRIGRGSARSP
ncbi:glycosyl hydrolase [Pseudolysinimonas kribbensis]|uniref:4,4'-diaponeurosporenoate glycosyltransferase n=1 Tax=Pseudolysinimonas kribbensis TaxID=433641 RepID=A0ABQ6K5A5_9MICO|nr:glycosyltransferase family 2 protein [Pseudolysinimonas kribbensis]GMA94614.1 glycosyl hydrolase [Pseudolysinimonas kribbensis]